MINNKLSAEEIIKLLDLKPHPEGGFFRETYRSNEGISASALPPRYGEDRDFGTAIFYMLTPGTFSAMHRIRSDEIFHFFLGDPATMLQLHPDGHGEIIALGHDIEAGQRLQVIVPRGVWQGMFLNDGGQFALMGTTVAPGFDFRDFEIGDRQALIKEFPKYAQLIKRLGGK